MDFLLDIDIPPTNGVSQNREILMNAKEIEQKYISCSRISTKETEHYSRSRASNENGWNGS